MYAANTDFPITWTWMSTYRTTARIDYVCIKASRRQTICNAYADENVDLNLDGSIDHRPVVVDVTMPKD
eukprot:4811812-Pyramimonas_sp.AAC.1